MQARSFSIRYKFLAVTTLLLVFCVLVYLVMATRTFKSDKTEMVFDYNKTLVVNLSSDFESVLRSVSDQLRLAAYFFTEGTEKDQGVIRDVLSGNPHVVFVGGSDRFEKIDKTFHVDQNYLETYGVGTDYFTQNLSQDRPVPFKEIQLHGEWIWNASVKDGPPLIGYAKSVVAEASDGTPLRQYMVLAYIRADKFLSTLRQGRINEVFVTNRAGEVLLHSDPAILYATTIPPRVSHFVSDALSNPARTSVKDFDNEGERTLGAYSKAFGDNLVVLSTVAGPLAFMVVNRLIWRSIMFGLMVLTLAFIAAVLFSRSLTRPIQVLTEGMEKVSAGDLDTQIHVTTRDEIRSLAGSFNGMIRDLKKSRRELEEINRDLENKVLERTQQLERQNQAVKSAQEALLRTTRLASVGEIAGRAAHEVLNPLTGILSRLERLRQRLAPDSAAQPTQVLEDLVKAWDQDFQKGGFAQLVQTWQQASKLHVGQNLWQEDLQILNALSDQVKKGNSTFIEDVDFLMREGQRISRIVQSMRSLSAVSSEPRPCNFAKIASQAVDIMADLASSLKVNMTFANMVTDDAIYADEDELVQSLTNLLRNAIQAVAERLSQPNANFKGFVRVELLDGGGQLLLHVRDNGVGVKEDDRVHLFETQFTTKSHRDGTGLGLNISRRFVRAFGGDIFLKESMPGVGSLFVMSMPKASSRNKESA